MAILAMIISCKASKIPTVENTKAIQELRIPTDSLKLLEKGRFIELENGTRIFFGPEFITIQYEVEPKLFSPRKFVDRSQNYFQQGDGNTIGKKPKNQNIIGEGISITNDKEGKTSFLNSISNYWKALKFMLPIILLIILLMAFAYIKNRINDITN